MFIGSSTALQRREQIPTVFLASQMARTISARLAVCGSERRSPRKWRNGSGSVKILLPSRRREDGSDGVITKRPRACPDADSALVKNRQAVARKTGEGERPTWTISLAERGRPRRRHPPPQPPKSHCYTVVCDIRCGDIPRQYPALNAHP